MKGTVYAAYIICVRKTDILRMENFLNPMTPDKSSYIFHYSPKSHY